MFPMRKAGEPVSTLSIILVALTILRYRLRTKRELKSRQAREKELTLQLNDLLSRPISLRGISARYITSGNANFANDMLAGSFNNNMIGMPNTRAVDDL